MPFSRWLVWTVRQKKSTRTKLVNCTSGCDCSGTPSNSVWSIRRTGPCIYTERAMTPVRPNPHARRSSIGQLSVRGRFRLIYYFYYYYYYYYFFSLTIATAIVGDRHYNCSHDDRFCCVWFFLLLLLSTP